MIELTTHKTISLAQLPCKTSDDARSLLKQLPHARSDKFDEVVDRMCGQKSRRLLVAGESMAEVIDNDLRAYLYATIFTGLTPREYLSVESEIDAILVSLTGKLPPRLALTAKMVNREFRRHGFQVSMPPKNVKIMHITARPKTGAAFTLRCAPPDDWNGYKIWMFGAMCSPNIQTWGVGVTANSFPYLKVVRNTRELRSAIAAACGLFQ